jgi:hypothetical protein
MPLSDPERDILRRLAEEQAGIAALPVQQEKARLWTALNDLHSTRPMVWIDEVPWNEYSGEPELALQTTDPWARSVETNLRQVLYQWKHFPADMVINNEYLSPLVIRSTGVGLTEDVDIVKTDEDNEVVSRRFHIQISNPDDIQKIKDPIVTLDSQATDENFTRLSEAFGDILPIRKTGRKLIWFAPWDDMVRWWGVEELMLDLVDRPQMVKDMIERLMSAKLKELDQWEALNLLSRNDDNTRGGSGGYGYVSDLPGKDFDPLHVHAKNTWGSSTAQIFGSVSPRMHWEFAMQYEARWLERFGLTYYGCCEPLDTKIQYLRRIPNLRKVSMSPWVDVERGARAIGTDYVYSRKPNPALLADETWLPECARDDLQNMLEKTRGCHVEIILKDISTVRYEPRRLWEWEKIAMELVQR